MIKTIFLYVTIFIVNTSYVHADGVVYYENNLYEDCLYWAEVGVNKDYIRVGYSGRCSDITLADLQREIRLSISEKFLGEKKEYIKKVFVNTYSVERGLTSNLKLIGSSYDNWKDELCMVKNSQFISSFFMRVKAILNIENYLASFFGNELNSLFIDADVEVSDHVGRQKTCLITSPGLIVFNVN